MKKYLTVLCALLLAAYPFSGAAASDTRLSGDADSDGLVTAADAAVVLRAADGAIDMDAKTAVLTDATGDMAVGRSDAVAILMLCTGSIAQFTELTTGGTDSLLGDRYLNKFSYQGAVRRQNNYRSAEIGITVTSRSYAGAVCHIADIYIRHIASLRTAFGGGSYNGGRETVGALSLSVGALLAVNGDQYLRVSGGPLVRNGCWYRDTVEYSADSCVLYTNGVMQTFAAGKADADALKSSDVWQSWICGPRLLDDESQPLKKFTCPAEFTLAAARTAIGYFEPGHYCFVVVDGTQNPDSDGILLEDLSALFHELGCTAAYNFYGGTSAVMCVGADAVNTPYLAQRTVSDILYIVEPAQANTAG